jgi:hypothetical protein
MTTTATTPPPSPPPARFEAREDGEEWGVWDTTSNGWARIGRLSPGGAISRWGSQEEASSAAARLNGCDDEELRRVARWGLS